MADPIISKLCPDTSGRYGAPMGRRSYGKDDRSATGPFWLRKIRLTEGYDPGGAYWGMRSDGMSLYGYLSYDGNVSGFLDAKDQKDALAELRKIHPNAKRA